jgi:hypothetical protein
MKMITIENAREYIFPIFSVCSEDNGVFIESREYLGTAFFVTRRGDAITADHVIPKPEQLEDGRRLIAVIFENGKQKICWITQAAKFELFDIALIHVNTENTKYLQISPEQVAAGTDVQTLGIPSHEVWGSGKEMRILKGHITLSSKYLELNFPVPPGMSGSPLLVGTKVVGYVTGTVRSEEIEDSTEEIEEVSDNKEVIRIYETRRTIHYGLAYPFSHLSEIHDPVLEGKTLIEFISGQNIGP